VPPRRDRARGDQYGTEHPPLVAAAAHGGVHTSPIAALGAHNESAPAEALEGGRR